MNASTRDKPIIKWGFKDVEELYQVGVDWVVVKAKHIIIYIDQSNIPPVTVSVANSYSATVKPALL